MHKWVFTYLFFLACATIRLVQLQGEQALRSVFKAFYLDV